MVSEADPVLGARHCACEDLYITLRDPTPANEGNLERSREFVHDRRQAINREVES